MIYVTTSPVLPELIAGVTQTFCLWKKPTCLQIIHIVGKTFAFSEISTWIYMFFLPFHMHMSKSIWENQEV